MGEAASPYITIEITLGEKQKGKRKATKGTLKLYSGTYQDYKYGQKGNEVLSVPIVSGGIDGKNVYEPVSKGIYKNRKFTTAKKGSGNEVLSDDAHGGPDNCKFYRVSTTCTRI